MVAPFVPAPKVLRTTIHYVTENVPWSVVLELGRTSEWPDGGGALADSATAVKEWATSAETLALFTWGTVVKEVTAQRMLAYAEPIYMFDVAPDAEGSIHETQLPNNCCVVLKKNTGATGRSNRGRSYFSGIPTAKMAAGDGGQVTSGHFTAWVAAGADLLATIAEVDNGAQLAVVSRFHKVGSTPSVPRDEAIFRYVTEFAPRNHQIYTRRKRMGHGSA